jgi:hypothetical protein
MPFPLLSLPHPIDAVFQVALIFSAGIIIAFPCLLQILLDWMNIPIPSGSELIRSLRPLLKGGYYFQPDH